jgi:ankyrin repeat protein
MGPLVLLRVLVRRHRRSLTVAAGGGAIFCGGLAYASASELRKRARVRADAQASERLRQSAAVGDTAVVERLLEAGAGHDPDETGCTPLHIAARGGHKGVARLLLEHKAAVDQPDSDGCSPLCIAAAKGREGMVRLLLEHKAAVDQHMNLGIDDGGQSAVLSLRAAPLIYLIIVNP